MSPDIRTVLLFGANGQLGRQLTQTLAASSQLTVLSRGDADFTEPESLRAVVRASRPEVVVNAAAYTAVDLAESNVEEAMAVNAEAPRVVAEEAERFGACMIHYSTDFIFDGCSNKPYVETDTPEPLSAYGRSKLEGERAVADNCRRHLILRTSWVFGAEGRNFLRTIMRLASEKESLRIVSDQIGAPTTVRLIAEVTARLLCIMAQASASDRRWGIYHLCSDGQTSWHEFAKYIISEAQARGFELKTTADNVAPIGTHDYPMPALRPKYSVLDTRKAAQTFDLEFPDWRGGVSQVLDELAKRHDD